MEHTKKSLTRSKSNCTPPFSSQTLEEIITFLSEGSGIDDDCAVYVVVHNIDGPGLRENEIQQYLATLAASSRVKFVASIDHVNAPLCKKIFIYFCSHSFMLLSIACMDRGFHG